ncbi:phage major capsid protein [Microvirga sp. SRT01]|uniref:Phage major capsid protein n=1 Tax=Sphingomonas longa TaxID=2778730 RepID=A0ABS2D603_9SPHN|nr:MULTISPECIES: phage major capsid protein [Alphaproteobacteria]MBM6576352.1 phage major capsid protein [Sphingomonas sp. BT552]MBR7709398.1 phage major capsid protein [Microvirga sp. SRT01]
MNLAVLKAEARATAQRQQERLQKAIDEDRDLTAEEETADADDKAKLARLTAQIQRAETLISTVSALGLPAQGEQTPAGQQPAPQGTIILPGQARATLDTGGFRNLAEFAQAVRCANPAAGQNFRMDDRLAAPGNVHMEQGDAAGSYLVPAEFRQQIVNLVFNDGNDPIMDLINPSPTASNRVIGLGDETTPWGNSGIAAAWRSEAEQMQPSRMGLTPRETKLNELYAFVLATEELLEDAPRVATLLTSHAAAAIRWKAADAFMYGNGIEKPLGWMESKALVAVAKDDNQVAATITASNVARMWARMIMPSQASWLVNSDIMPTLMSMRTEGSNMPLWFGNYQEAPGGTLLGRPVVFNEHSRSVGQLGDIQFVNPNGYEAFRKQNGVSFADSIHLYFDYNIRAFRWIFRIGGQPVLSKPVAPANGGAVKSHFVALAERA